VVKSGKRVLPLLTGATALFALFAVMPAHAARPVTGRWTGQVTKGQALSGKDGMPTFRVSANQRLLTNFKIGGIGGYCASGYQVVSVVVPRAKIKASGKFKVTYHPVRGSDAKVTLSGTFTRARRVTGKVEGRNFCDYDIHFKAHPG